MAALDLARPAPPPASPKSGLTDRIARESTAVGVGDSVHRYLVNVRGAWPAGERIPPSIRIWWDRGSPHVVFAFDGEDGTSWQYERLSTDGRRLSPRYRRGAGTLAGKLFTVPWPGSTRHAWVEGPLTALAAAQLYECTAHATGGTNGLRQLKLPPGEHVLDADGDFAGWQAVAAVKTRNPYSHIHVVERLWGDALDELTAEREERLALEGGY